MIDVNAVTNEILNEVSVSVLMPVYNGQEHLHEAIDSILNQTFSEFELIIIDDGSSDHSLKILRSYEVSDHRVKVFTRANCGVVATRNELLGMAKGKWIAWMDQDDISLPSRLEKQITTMEIFNADVCGCHWIVINEEGAIVDTRVAPITADSFTICLCETVPFAHGSVMMRNSFVKVNKFQYGERRYAEDYDLWIRLFEADAIFANVNEFLFKYRDYSNSLSKRKYRELAADTKLLKLGYLERNIDACLISITNLSYNSRRLSLFERVNLLTASFRASLILRRPIFLKIISVSNRRSVMMAFLELIK